MLFGTISLASLINNKSNFSNQGIIISTEWYLSLLKSNDLFTDYKMHWVSSKLWLLEA